MRVSTDHRDAVPGRVSHADPVGSLAPACSGSSAERDQNDDAESGRFTAAEARAMDLALDAAAEGVRGANPLVGAVLLDDDGRVLAVGHHRGAGTDHAEVDVLARAVAAGLTGEQIAAATLIVTLEPCNHTGRTGACTEAILAAGIGSVIHAIDDPHRAAAGGARRLRDAGVRVRSGLRAAAARELNRRWLAVVGVRPFVTVKVAQSLDGCIAAADGTSQWITGAQARADGHRVRALADAVVVGTGTVHADDPTLTARLPDGTLHPRQPRRVVVGLRDTPADAAVRGDDDRFLALRTRDPNEALATLYDGGARHVLVDGSPHLVSAFASAGLIDELVLYQAPVLLGGRPAWPALGIATLVDALQLEPDDAGGGAVTRLGPDTRLRFVPGGRGDGAAVTSSRAVPTSRPVTGPLGTAPTGTGPTTATPTTDPSGTAPPGTARTGADPSSTAPPGAARTDTGPSGTAPPGTGRAHTDPTCATPTTATPRPTSKG